jgi:hypothetical protein
MQFSPWFIFLHFKSLSSSTLCSQKSSVFL